MVSVTEKLGFASLTEAISLNNANVVIIDPVHHTAAKHFPLSRLMSKERRLQLENADFDIRVQHVKYDVLIDYLSAHKFSGLYKAGTSQVMDALTMTPIEDDDDLIGTINSQIMSRKLEGVMLLCQTTKPPGNPNRGIARTLKTEIYITNIYMQYNSNPSNHLNSPHHPRRES